MRGELFLLLMLSPMIATSGQQNYKPIQQTESFPDTIQEKIDHKADSIINIAARKIDSILERPKVILLKKDILYSAPGFPDHGVYWYFKVYKYSGDTIYSHTKRINF